MSLTRPLCDAERIRLLTLHYGLSIKYVTIQWEGVRDSVTVCDRETGSKDQACSHTYFDLYHAYKICHLTFRLLLC